MATKPQPRLLRLHGPRPWHGAAWINPVTGKHTLRLRKAARPCPGVEEQKRKLALRAAVVKCVEDVLKEKEGEGRGVKMEEGDDVGKGEGNDDRVVKSEAELESEAEKMVVKQEPEE